MDEGKPASDMRNAMSEQIREQGFRAGVEAAIAAVEAARDTERRLSMRSREIFASAENFEYAEVQLNKMADRLRALLPGEAK